MTQEAGCSVGPSQTLKVRLCTYVYIHHRSVDLCMVVYSFHEAAIFPDFLNSFLSSVSTDKHALVLYNPITP